MEKIINFIGKFMDISSKFRVVKWLRLSLCLDFFPFVCLLILNRKELIREKLPINAEVVDWPE